jgi:hypothetical protein
VANESIKIKCSCGCDQFHIPASKKADDVIKCANCGASATYGEATSLAVAATKARIEKEFKSVFKKSGISSR